MNPSNVIKFLEKAVVCPKRNSIFLAGNPGIGKSQVVKGVANRLGVEFIDVRLSQLSPVDLRGLPAVKDGEQVWALPAFLPKTGRGILLLDEFNHASQDVQAASYQLVLDHQLGDYILPEGWIVIAAGNLDTDGAITNKMGTALRSRFCQIEVNADLKDWTNWAFENSIMEEIIAFVNFKPDLFHAFDKKAKAFPCPRTWEFASDFIKQGHDDEIAREMLNGIIGEGATNEFMAFLQIYQDLPNLANILLNPESAEIPERTDIMYAVCSGLAHKATKDNMESVVTYAARLEKEGKGEYAIFLMKAVGMKHPKLCNTRAYNQWTGKQKEL